MDSNENKAQPDLITPQAEEALLDIDKRIEEMLKENSSLGETDPQPAPTISADDLDAMTSRRKGQQTKEEAKDISQIYEVPPERLDKLYQEMLQKENETLDNLLEMLAASVGFNGGMQKFLDVVINQLKLGDINLKKERFDPIMQHFLDLKVVMLLLNTLSDGRDKEALDEIALSINNKLMHSFFNLLPKDNSFNLITDLQRSLTSGLKDLSFEVSKGSSKQNEAHNAFLKKLENVLKKNHEK